MRTLILGGTGFVGRHIAERCLPGGMTPEREREILEAAHRDPASAST